MFQTEFELKSKKIISNKLFGYFLNLKFLEFGLNFKFKPKALNQR
jgi:hypothetical protein